MKKQVKIRFWLLMYVSLAQNFIFCSFDYF